MRKLRVSVLAVLDGVHDLRELCLGQILRADRGVNVGLGENVFRVARADAVDIPQRNINPLVRRHFNSDYTSHTLKNGLMDSWINGLIDAETD